MRQSLLIGLISVSMLMGCSGPTGARIERHTEKKPAPNFELRDIDGNRVALQDLRGKPVILAFFALGCGPCRTEAPHLSELARMHADQGLHVLAVNAWDEDVALLRRFAADEKLTQRILVNGSETAQAYGLGGSVPAVFWIDAQGTIADADWGFSGPAALKKKTEQLLQVN